MTALLAALIVAPLAQGPILSMQEEDDGFKPLFNGRDLKNWKGYRRPTAPGSWKVENGVLLNKSGDDGGDLSTGDDYEASWQTGPEYQLFDDFQSDSKGKKDLHSAGALYDVYVPSKFVTKKPGQWNQTRIVCEGNHIRHYLNGVKIVDCRVGSA